MKKILITGGSGFIGKSLVEGLKNKYQTYAPKHSEVDILSESNIKRYFKKVKPDIIIHAASAGDYGKVNCYEPNMKMFLNLSDNFKGRMIYFGSGAEFDKRYNITNASEDNLNPRDIFPIDEYGHSKHVMSHYARNIKSKEIFNLRLFGIYGEKEDCNRRFISKSIMNALNNQPIEIFQDCTYSYLYIDDLIKITEHFINIKSTKTGLKDFNIVPDEEVKLSQIAKIIKDISDKKVKINIKENTKGKDYYGSNARLKKEMGQFEFTKIEKGVEIMYRYLLKRSKTCRNQFKNKA